MVRGCAKIWDARDKSFGSSCAYLSHGCPQSIPVWREAGSYGANDRGIVNLSSLIASTGKKAALPDLRNRQSSVPFPCSMHTAHAPKPPPSPLLLPSHSHHTTPGLTTPHLPNAQPHPPLLPSNQQVPPPALGHPFIPHFPLVRAPPHGDCQLGMVGEVEWRLRFSA